MQACRLRHLLWLGVILALTAPVIAQNTQATFETVTFGSNATGFTATTITPDGLPVMTVCRGKLETAQIRVRYDGTNPTSSVGALVDVGEVITIRGYGFLKQFKGIATGATSGVAAFHCTRL